MSQDVLALGLDISSFGPDKKKTLDDFIARFETLDKYDGKVYNPIMGSGLTEFNASMKETNILLADLVSKFANLGNAAKSNAISMNSSASATNANAAATKKATTSVLDLAIAKNKAAEASTRLAVADVREANSKSQAATAALKLANANLSAATSSNRSERAAIQHSASQTALAASLTARVVAERQAIAADYQMSTANELSALTANQNTSAQNLASSATVRAAIASRTAAASINAASANISSVSQNANTATTSMGLLGNSFSRNFGYIRNLAYILPGIGLAGIFNLIFEAIGKTIEVLLDFGDSIEKTTKVEVAFNNVLKEQIELQKSIIEQREKLIELATSESSYKKKIGLDIASAQGQDKLSLNKLKVDVSTSEYEDARAKLPPGTDINTIFKQIKTLTDKQKFLDERIITLGILAAAKDDKTMGDRIKLISDIIVITNKEAPSSYQKLMSKKVDGKYVFSSQSELDALVSGYKSELELAKLQSTEKLGILKDYFDKETAMHVSIQEQAKAINDEERKMFIDKNKQEIESEVKKNKAILDDNRNTQNERLAAIEIIRQQEKKLHDIERISVTGITSADAAKYGVNVNINPSASLYDIANSKKKQDEDDKRQDIETQQDKNKVNIEFYQRLIAAREDIAKNNLEKEAIINERIYKDDENGLEQRLLAYSKYVDAKQKIQDVEYDRAIQKGAIGPGGITELTPAEKVKLGVERDTQQSNAQADYEKQAFEITYSYLQKRLNSIKDENHLEFNINKAFYAGELRELNDSFEKKTIKYKDYKKKVESIERKYGIAGPDEAVTKDLENLHRLDKEQIDLLKKKEAADKEVQNATAGNTGPKSSVKETLDAQKRYDNAVGVQRGINAALIKLEVEYETALDSLKDDALKKELARIQKQVEAEKEAVKKREALFDALNKIEQAIYRTTKAIGDDVYKRREEKSRDAIKLVDDELDSELVAVEKSSLKQKDKAALEIQLQTEKMVADKNAAQEQKKIAHDKAVFDRDLAIAHIILNTAIGISNALSQGDPYTAEIRAIAAGVVGAAALVEAIAVQIPSYAEGGIHKKDGLARYGEAGTEVVKEPYKSPYLVHKETIGFLPAGTELIPAGDTEVYEKQDNNSWAQTIWLAKQLKGKKEKTVVKNTINIDFSFEEYKHRKLYYN